MNLKRFLLGSLVPGALLLACGGHVVSIGSNGEELKTYDPSAVKVASTACPSGYQHPNICCVGGGSGKAAECEAYVNHPFHSCEQGWTAYPNALACCSLSDPGSCVECDEQGNCNGNLQPPPPPIDPGQCPSACPPGYTGDGPDSPGGCCSYDANNGTGTCFANAHSDDPAPPSTTPGSPVPQPYPPIDAGPAPDAGQDGGVATDASVPPTDGGVIDAGPYPGDGGGGGCVCAVPVTTGPNAPATDAEVPPSPYPDGGVCNCPIEPPPPVCDNACPPNWSSAGNGVCCLKDPTGNTECFSTPRAVPSLPAVGSGGGTSGSGSANGGNATTGSGKR